MNRESNAIAELRRQVSQLFGPSADASPNCVGAEVELLVFDRSAANGHGVVPVDRLAAILATDSRLAAEACFSFEPGGQLELSPAPAASARHLVATLRRLVAGTDALLARHGIGTSSRPVDPWRTASELGLQTPAERYVAMQRHFDSIGPAGRQMMRRTASLQVTIDLLPGEAGRRQWLLANLAAPALALAFGRPAREDGGESRLGIWRRVDPSRTGFDGVQVDGRRPETGYALFAAAAEAMPLRREGGEPSLRALQSRLPFLDWARMGAARPDTTDVAYHLSTLFPPVRPRGRYLEIRFCDAQPADWLDVPISVSAVLLGQAPATGEALELVGSDTVNLAGRWGAAADGADPGMLAVGLELFAIAARRGRLGSAGLLPSNAPDLIDDYARRYLRPVAEARPGSMVGAAVADPAPIGHAP
jgi:glutamate--cysteine ligase